MNEHAAAGLAKRAQPASVMRMIRPSTSVYIFRHLAGALGAAEFFLLLALPWLPLLAVSRGLDLLEVSWVKTS